MNILRAASVGLLGVVLAAGSARAQCAVEIATLEFGRYSALESAPLRTSATMWGVLTARQRVWAASMSL